MQTVLIPTNSSVTIFKDVSIKEEKEWVLKLKAGDFTSKKT